MTAIREHLLRMGIQAQSLDDSIALTVDAEDQLVGAVVQVENFDPVVHVQPSIPQPVHAAQVAPLQPSRPRTAEETTQDVADIQSLVKQSQGLALDLGNRVTVEPLLGIEDARR